MNSEAYVGVDVSKVSLDVKVLPTNETLQHATKMSIVEDKPIMLDYWVDSLDKKVLIGTVTAKSVQGNVT